MGGVRYNPVSEAGAEDAVEPALLAGNQVVKHFNPAKIKKPVPLNWRGLGLATAGGIVTESTAQQLMDATRGGESNPNPYLENLERTVSRLAGGATSGAIYGKSVPGAILGTIGAGALDAGENIYGIARGVPELISIYQAIYEQNRILEKMEKEDMQRHIERKLLELRTKG